MEITQQVTEAVIQKEATFEKDQNFVRLAEFYKEMKRLGIAQKQKYTLPPLDTIGQNYPLSNSVRLVSIAPTSLSKGIF